MLDIVSVIRIVSCFFFGIIVVFLILCVIGCVVFIFGIELGKVIIFLIEFRCFNVKIFFLFNKVNFVCKFNFFCNCLRSSFILFKLNLLLKNFIENRFLELFFR